MTPPPPPDSNVASPTSDMPESQSTETILDEEETADREREGAGGDASKIPNVSTTDSKKPNSNGIDSGITLTPASLEMVDKSKRPIPYANVGSKKKQGVTDDEIKC